MSNFWSIYIIAIVVINIAGCAALLFFTRKKKESSTQGKTTGHVYDGIEEYDNPLPRWWLWMFYITIIFSVIYLVLYPGLGKFQGVLGWSQVNQYNEEVAKADEQFMPMYEKYAAMSVEELQNKPEALDMGQSIFANTCFGCHGADGRGALGFPDLTDNDWLYGGTPEQIKKSIVDGRRGLMPAWEATLGEQGVSEVIHYVLSKNNAERSFREELVEAGETKYNQFCAACHGKDLTGNVALGAANLADTVWLHGGSISMIKNTVANGIQANMPAHKDILGEEKIHLVTAYVYSLSRDEQVQALEDGGQK
ncbi:MAG: cytochrome-c oxidase, cbb3-type subunit III [Kangiellaceae bacterium]|nr:cytochrome-c oxidase, cbb3-type subunit III [Kangiellaceae bacterium]